MKDYWIKSSIFSFTSNSVLIGFAFLTFLVLVRVLPQDVFGVWVLYLTVTTFTEIVRNGMTHIGLVKFLAESTGDERNKIITAALFINLSTGIFGVVLIYAFATLISQIFSTPTLAPVLRMYGVYVLFYMPLSFIEFLCIANLDFKARFFSILTYNAVDFFLITGWAFLRGNLQVYELPIVQGCAAFMGLLVMLRMGGKYIRIQFDFDWQWVSRLFHYGKFVFATSFSSMMFNRVDLMMIGYYLNPAAVAIYNIPTRIGNYVEVPMNAISSIVFPKAAQRQKELGMDAVRYLYERSVGAMLAVVIPAAIVLFVFAKPIILLVAGAQYLPAVPVLQIFAVISMIKPFGRQGGMILDSIGHPNYNFYLLVLSLLINVILNWFFIIHYGVMGAIVATLLAVAIGTLMLLMLLIRLIQIKIHHPFIYMWAFYRDAFRKISASGGRYFVR